MTNNHPSRPRGKLPAPKLGGCLCHLKPHRGALSSFHKKTALFPSILGSSPKPQSLGFICSFLIPSTARLTTNSPLPPDPKRDRSVADHRRETSSVVGFPPTSVNFSCSVAIAIVLPPPSPNSFCSVSLFSRSPCMQVIASSSSPRENLLCAMDPDMEKSGGSVEEDCGEKKVCCDCKTTRTPLWRSGPAGPKSLCNACGIRFRKRRRAMEDPTAKKRATPLPSPPQIASSSAAATSTSESTTTADTGPVKVRVVYSGKRGGMMVPRSPPSVARQQPHPSEVVVKKQSCQRRRRKLAEEEQAAFVLMALSCGAVFA
ncbi:unnamed protein product [Linum tenue]|uniref:GATA-type domain-containing protein n=1 Tax=Linum tenue TaxID=586396 RepID=A0AAV0R391_9ROSI|nr:unnamed protein product [Linum tenue]